MPRSGWTPEQGTECPGDRVIAPGVCCESNSYLPKEKNAVLNCWATTLAVIIPLKHLELIRFYMFSGCQQPKAQ